MDYPEELRERYNEVMYDERDVIERFCQTYDGWHFETAVELIGNNGDKISVTDIRLDKDRLVVFVGLAHGKRKDYECCDFAYGELSKVIEAL